MSKDRPLEEVTENLISDLAKSKGSRKSEDGALLEEPSADQKGKDQFSAEVGEALRATEKDVVNLIGKSGTPPGAWQVARELVERFQPVPWFIWRLSNFVLGKPGKIGKVNDGLVFGLRRLLFAAGSDATLGSGEKVNDMRTALKVIAPDVIAATAVIHAICRRIGHSHSERIYRPLLDDALIRAKLGFYVGRQNELFGPGRGMLAGFAGRAGLVIQVVSGDTGQAKSALDQLASGASLGEIGHKVYGCDPLQVSAMLLSASGCGKDAAFGVVRYSIQNNEAENSEQKRWFSAFSAVECARMHKFGKIEEEDWSTLGFETRAKRDELADLSKKIVRRGHEWNWIV